MSWTAMELLRVIVWTRVRLAQSLLGTKPLLTINFIATQSVN